MRIFLALIFILLTNQSLGQVKGFLSFGGDLNSGNFNSIGLTARGELKIDTNLKQFVISSAYRWSEQSSGNNELKKYEDELYLTSNLSRSIKNWKVLGFAEAERSYLRKIDLRSSAGLGAGYEIFNGKGWSINISEILLPEYYWSDVNSQWNNFTIRASTRFKIEYESVIIKITSVSLFQPSIFSSRETSFLYNLNARNNTAVSVKIANKYEVGLSYVLTYQGYPAYINSTIRPTQQNSSVFLKYSF